MEEIGDEKLPKLLIPIRAHIDDIFVPFRQVERIHPELLEWMPEQIVDALALAWHDDHLFYQSHGKKKHDHRRESDYWLIFSEGLLDDPLDEFKVLGRVCKLRCYNHRSVAAINHIARSWAAHFSSRIAIRRFCLNRLIRRSTRSRRR
jgi:hypothetical protein